MTTTSMPRGGPNATWLDRAYEPSVIEWLDDPNVPQHVKDREIEGLARFNAASLGYWSFTRFVVDALPPTTQRVILELGAGNGELCGRLAKKLPNARVIASELDEGRLKRMRGDPVLRARGVEIMALDARRIALPDQSVDVAVFVQGLHHLTPPEVTRLFEEGTRVAKRLLVIDGWRHPLMLAVTPFIWLVGNYPAFRDGVVSLRRMYSVQAVRHMAAESSLDLKVEAGFAAPGYMKAIIERR